MLRDATASGSSSSKPLGRQLAVLATAATLAVGGVTAYTLWRFQSSQSRVEQTPLASVPEVKTVTALGRLEPRGEVIRLSAPTSAEGSRVEQLLVKEGDRVKVGQVIAILDNRARLQAALMEAQTQVSVARSRLDQVKAGAKTGEIQAQEAKYQQTKAELEGQIPTQKASIANLEAQLQGEKSAQAATIERIEAELRDAQTDCQRYQRLYQNGAVSAQERDRNCLQAETTQKSLKEAQANLNRIVTSRQAQINEAQANLNRTVATYNKQIEEARATLGAVAQVRPVDVRVAQKQVEASQAAVERAQADLDRAYVKAPQDGQVLKIHARHGELISSEDGIAEIGQTQQMYAIAEVYESDVTQVRPGHQARVTSDSISGELRGTVEQVGLRVLKQNVINTDPSANIDARVVEVKVRLDEASSRKAAGFTNLQVKVVIQL